MEEFNANAFIYYLINTYGPFEVDTTDFVEAITSVPENYKLAFTPIDDFTVRIEVSEDDRAES